MKIERHVPLGSALRAATDAIDHTQRPDPANAAFIEWYHQPRYQSRSILDFPSLPVDEVAALVEEAPDTPAGIAWREAAARSLALTRGDVTRPYDEATYDTADEDAALAALDEFAEALRDVSPLLREVADVIERQAPHQPFALGDLHDERARIAADGIVIGEAGYCDKHQDHCYGDHRAVARWEHLEAIHTGLRATLADLLARVDVDIPEVGPHDNGDARQLRRND